MNLEEEGAVIVDSELDHADRNDVRFDVELELTDLQLPREVHQLTSIDRTAQFLRHKTRHNMSYENWLIICWGLQGTGYTYTPRAMA